MLVISGVVSVSVGIIIIMVLRGVLLLALMTLVVVVVAAQYEPVPPYGSHKTFKTVLKAGEKGVDLSHQNTIKLNNNCDLKLDLNDEAKRCWLSGLSVVRLTLEAAADAAPVFTLLDEHLGTVRLQRTPSGPLGPRCWGDVKFEYTCKYILPK